MRSSTLARRVLRLAAALGAVGLTLGAAGTAQARPPVGTDVIDTTGGTGNVVGFTFDDGPNPVDTPRLLEVLRRHRVKAVFCLVGDQVEAHPELVRRIVAAGHTLCNHSMHHDDLSAWTPEQVEADLRQTSAAIRRAVPHARIPFFRAPYGAWGQAPTVAASLGMRSLGWRLAISDWEPPGTDVLVDRLLDGITPGAVVLMHDGGGDRSQTVAAVDRVIPILQSRHWRFTRPDPCR
ncbi:polysaccharide deacetylase family protein [Micromonospora zhanjiangensis]|uniref:Polysaccharide deacetylase family protein n=1 Tax=Micromonospora zhanjiangensis TaxID=1522057 RepID=A0ABV8KJL9_9ACTN